MNTTESLVAELAGELAEHEAAGQFVAAQARRQQIIAHETLARLRAEQATNPSGGLAAQIEFWRSKVEIDIDTAPEEEPSDPQPAPSKRRRAAAAEPDPEQGEA